MAVDRLKRETDETKPKNELCYIDRSFISRDPVETYGDMYWSFDVADTTYSFDVDRLCKISTNHIIDDIANDSFEDIPVYEIRRKVDCELVAAVLPEDVDQAVRDYLTEDFGKDVKMVFVPKDQKFIELPEVDESMIEYKNTLEEKVQMLGMFFESMLHKEHGVRIDISPITAHDMTFNAISWHYGMDGDIYYNLFDVDGTSTVGMNEDRLADFLIESNLDEISRLSSSVKKYGFNPDIEELLYLEMTVGGSVLDHEFVYECTESLNAAGMTNLKESLSKRVSTFYEGLHSANHLSDKDYQDAIKGIPADIDAWLSKEALLRGRMDYNLHKLISGRKNSSVTGLDVSKVAIELLRAPDATKESRLCVVKWVKDTCKSNNIKHVNLTTPVYYAVRQNDKKI